MERLIRRSLLLVAFLLVLQLLVGTTVVLADPGYHMVRAGETLSSIGRMYGVSPYVIAQVNGLSNPNYIRIGQVLYIPDGSSGAPYAPPQPYHYPWNYWWYYQYQYQYYYPYYWWNWYWWDP